MEKMQHTIILVPILPVSQYRRITTKVSNQDGSKDNRFFSAWSLVLLSQGIGTELFNLKIKYILFQ